jgi:2,5-diketo-D-gluconate reductase A
MMAKMEISSRTQLLTGREMPIMGLGTWQLRGDDTFKAITYALKIGYRMVDTSGDYGNHHQVGKAIRESGIPRSEIFLVTKVEENEDAYDSAEENLKELGLDYADLMLIHRPPRHGAGGYLWEGLIKAQKNDLAKDIGVSNYSIDQIEAITLVTGKRPVVNQIEWSPFGYSPDMLQYCRQHKIVLQAYSPLTRTKRLNEPVLTDIGAKYNKTPAQLLLRWDIQHGVVPLPKATSKAHISENAGIFDFALTRNDLAALDNLNEYYSSLSALPYIQLEA